MWCDTEILDRLDRQSALRQPMEFSEAWRSRTWEGTQAHLAVLIEDEEIRWLGRAIKRNKISSRDWLIKVTEIEDIEPLPLAEVRAMAGKYGDGMNRAGILPQSAGAAVTGALRTLRPAYADLIARLERPRDLQLPTGARRELINQERDALGLLLDIAGIDRGALHTWSDPQTEVPFLQGIPHTTAFEDHLIIHDLERFSSWLPLPVNQVAWRAFTDGRRRMFVMNANRTPVEHCLGVDVVYWNESHGAFVLVQYKKMRHEGEGTRQRPVYMPDHNLASELSRMRQIDALCSTSDEDYRLLSTPCWLKLCEPDARVKDMADLIQGMYLAREHFEGLLKTQKGPRGGTYITYDNVPRHLNNTMFIDLVRDGWLGSRGPGTDEIRDLIQQSIQTGHAVMLGIQQQEPQNLQPAPDQAVLEL